MSSQLINIILYSTVDCHLCEQAAEMLYGFEQQGLVVIETIDIARNDDFLELYGLRIPVIKRMDTGEELGWPFDHVKLGRYLK